MPLYGRLVGEEHLASLAQQAAATSIAVPSDDRSGDRQILQARIPPVVAAVVPSSLNHRLFRDPATGPLRKLSVDLIKTYKHINEVRCVYRYLQSGLVTFNVYFSWIGLNFLV